MNFGHGLLYFLLCRENQAKFPKYNLTYTILLTIKKDTEIEMTMLGSIINYYNQYYSDSLERIEHKQKIDVSDNNYTKQCLQYIYKCPAHGQTIASARDMNQCIGVGIIW